MIKRRYKLPIQGTVIAREPLTGAEDDPICPISLEELVPTEEIIDPQTKESVQISKLGGWGCESLDYNIDEEWCEVELEADEEFHSWLTSMLPQLRAIQKERSWKLDKSKLEEK